MEAHGWTQGLTYAGLGLVVVGVCGFMFWEIAKSVAKRSKSEGDLDTRAAKLVETIQKPFEAMLLQQGEMLSDARTTAAKANDARDEVMRQFVNYSTDTQRFHSQELQKLRDDALAATQRMHNRLDECEKRHQQCDTRLEDALKRIETMEAREAARIARPPMAVMVPVPAGATGTGPSGA